jgi:hypothetical protein
MPPPTDANSNARLEAEVAPAESRCGLRAALASRPGNRQTRMRFGSRRALLDALCRARQESWVSGMRVDAEALELVLDWGVPRRSGLRLIRGGAARG